MRWLRKLFGMCEHEFEHVSNIVTTDGPIEVSMCYKCFKMQFRIWQRGR
jgi:hypothetical protein